MGLPVQLSLICLAPEPQCGEELALHLGADLAELLNYDEGLPEGVRRPPGAPLETAETVLSFTKEWCLKRHARCYAIVIEGSKTIGTIRAGPRNSDSVLSYRPLRARALSHG